MDSEFLTSLPSGSDASQTKSTLLRNTGIKKGEAELVVECGVNYRVRNAGCTLLLVSI